MLEKSCFLPNEPVTNKMHTMTHCTSKMSWLCILFSQTNHVQQRKWLRLWISSAHTIIL